MGLVAFLTINGMSVPGVATVATVIMIAVGLLLPSAGMVVLRRGLDRVQGAARNGFLLQGVGLVTLFVGVVLAVGLSSLLGYFVGAVLLIASASSSLLGAMLLRGGRAGIGVPGSRISDYFLLGTLLIFSGVGLIMASNIAFYYAISQVANTAYVDLGAAISACGCVVAGYSFAEVRSRLRS
jgi:hypothetical protein